MAGARFNTGVEDFFRDIDLNLYIPVFISGGFQELIEKAQRILINHNGESCVKHGFAACEYIWDDNGLLKTWNIHPSDFNNKYAYLKLILKQYELSETSDWIFIGDGKNDADIASRAPVSFAINPHPELAAVATYTIDSFNEIFELLNSDENARNVSKKRGLSNKQSVIVGQRLINSGKMHLTSFCDNFNCDNGKVKYRLKAELLKLCKEDTLFLTTIDTILNWCEIYSDDKTKYKSIYNYHKQTDNYDIVFNGIATIKIACLDDIEKQSWSLFVSAPDVGTELRQAVLGAKVEIHILLENIKKDKNRLKLEMYIVTKVPNNSHIKTHNIQLEAFCPLFIKELCNQNIDIWVDGKKFLSKDIEFADSAKISSIVKESNRTIPVIFISEDKNIPSKCSIPDIGKIFDYTFGFAQIYKAKSENIYNIFGTEKTAITILLPDGTKKYYSQEYINKPSDAIGYSCEKSLRMLYSTGDESEAVAINVADFIIESYKTMLSNIEWNDRNTFYTKVSEIVHDDELRKKIVENRKVTTDELTVKSKKLVIDISKIELAEKAAIDALNSMRITDSQQRACLLGTRNFLEKGELLLSALSEVVGSNEMYPVSVIQPIACAFEICINLLLLNKTRYDYFVIKESNKEAGKIITEIENRKLVTFQQLQILKKALKRRNESAHPNHMYKYSDINNGPKKDLYEAIKLISQIM